MKWIAALLFALFVAGSFACYGAVFRALGPPPTESLAAFLRYAVRAVTRPAFLGGMGLAFTGSVLRLLMFKHLGISRTVLVSELSVVLMMGVGILAFGDQLRFPRDYLGGLLVILGAYVVSAE